MNVILQDSESSRDGEDKVAAGLDLEVGQFNYP